ncbi:MAG: glycosyltransferase [Bacteroidales bacterium]|nr:glycosyltransferase [Bacteroidales bacterium]
MIQTSIVIPVYNRPEELRELLDSLTLQHDIDKTEVVVVEDGSMKTSEEVVSQFERQLNIRYIRQENTGPAVARNNGAKAAKGEFLYFFDSDCILPAGFMEAIEPAMNIEDADCIGTADHSHPYFTPIQKAISYSMTSVFTTGGIRGGSSAKMDSFFPRSYSMGVRRSVFEAVGGFANMRYGEDVDLSMRIKEAGYKLWLVRETYVYHKRRTNFKSFFKQTFCSGTARIDLSLRHPGTLKLVHVLPTVAVIMLIALIVLAIVAHWGFAIPLAIYAGVIFIDSLRKERDVWVAMLSIVSSAIQICGYGLGFLYNVWVRLILGRRDAVAFRNTLYD